MALALDLQDFLVRARVLKLYRQALRISRRAPGYSKDSSIVTKPFLEIVLFKQHDEVRQIIRQEMENNRTCKDKQRIRFLISDGLDRLKRLDETLDMQGR